MTLWSVSAFLTISGLGDIAIWFKLMTASMIMMLVAMFFFIQSMLGFRRKWAPLTIVYGILVIFVTLTSSVMVKSASLDQTGQLQYTLGDYFRWWLLPDFP
jgi:hypothetical protein